MYSGSTYHFDFKHSKINCTSRLLGLTCKACEWKCPSFVYDTDAQPKTSANLQRLQSDFLCVLESFLCGSFMWKYNQTGILLSFFFLIMKEVCKILISFCILLFHLCILCSVWYAPLSPSPSPLSPLLLPFLVPSSKPSLLSLFSPSTLVSCLAAACCLLLCVCSPLPFEAHVWFVTSSCLSLFFFDPLCGSSLLSSPVLFFLFSPTLLCSLFSRFSPLAHVCFGGCCRASTCCYPARVHHVFFWLFQFEVIYCLNVMLDDDDAA